MQSETISGTPQPYTILRIKRKRNEEPLDALAVESRIPRKKSRGGIGLFKFAQTVEPNAWDDEQKQKDLQDQISRLTREPAQSEDQEPPPTTTPVKSPPPPPSPNQDRNRRYAIINAPEPEPDLGRRAPTSPPKILSSKDVARLKNKALEYRLYDAVLASEKEDNMDTEMEKFMPMIRDYLKLHDISTDAEASVSPAKSPTEDTDDYVWDVFYHKPVTLSEWNSVAANIGTLTGLPPSLTDLDDSDSDSEVEDEANEDSNDEAYYKNDYPDEESDDYDSEGSDAFHESSDHEGYYKDDNDLDWR
ncbi:hypothetical protein HGRIS_005886 [Hohenbuehelia grisea]|uniref:Probable RNA polymerase II nuclear localization protein SLC7A6OS n=1 Tax=Hohenbuehelia grisea TaxID=104357 RepID=A0ABR3JYM7_9AGAR